MSLHPKQAATVKLSSNISQSVAEPKERLGWRRWLKRMAWRVGLLGSLLLVLLVFGFYVSQPRFYHILVIGSDQRNNEPARSDALLIVSIPKAKADPLSLTMVPRDTKMEDGDYGLQKITHFYAMWDDSIERMGNVVLTESKVEELLDIEIHGTVEVTFDSFTDIVDTVGGVDMSTGHVDGAEAQELIHNRFVQPAGDFGRATEQREIFKAVLQKVKNPAIARQLYDYLQTSQRARLRLSKSSLIGFGIAYLLGQRSLDVPEIEEVVLPGEGQRIYTPSFGKSLYYWVLDEEATQQMVEKYLE